MVTYNFEYLFIEKINVKSYNLNKKINSFFVFDLSFKTFILKDCFI